MRWKTLLFVLGGLVVGVLLAILVFINRTGTANTGTAGRRLPPVVGSPAPGFDLPVLGGQRQVLQALKGTPVIVNFWATWCLPCREEMPLLDQVSKQYAGKLVVLGIDSEEEEKVASNFVTELGVTFPILLDRSGAVTDLYFVRNFPITFFIDSDGTLRAQHLGTLDQAVIGRYLKAIGLEP